MHQPPPALTDLDESWPVEESTDLHRGDWVVALRSDRVRRPDQPGSEPFDRLVLEHPGAAIVLALDEEGRVCLLSQYRHAAKRRFVELPAGLCDEPGEDPLQVARRELREEAGLQADAWTHLGSTYSSPGISSEVMHFYLARDLAPDSDDDFVREHEEADMQLFWAPFQDLLDAVLDGRVADGPLVTAVLLVVARGLQPGLPPGR